MTTARMPGMNWARVAAAPRYQPALRAGSPGSSTVPVSATMRGFPLADPQAENALKVPPKSRQPAPRPSQPYGLKPSAAIQST